MNFWTDVWNALTGIGTLTLAGVTFCVIRQGQRQREDIERQHRDRFKPICLLAPYDGVDSWNRRGDLLEVALPAPDNPSCGTVAIRCVLGNVGAGPALKLRLKFRFPNREGWTTNAWELSPLAAKESIGNTDAPLRVPIKLQPAFTATDLSTITGDLWEIWLEYEDVFGKPFHSIHRKAPVDTDLSTATWTTAGPDQQPRASLRPIPWFTYNEGPMP